VLDADYFAYPEQYVVLDTETTGLDDDAEAVQTRTALTQKDLRAILCFDIPF
jgi:DNA polymerase III alpha subunit (gram-positive type)